MSPGHRTPVLVCVAQRHPASHLSCNEQQEAPGIIERHAQEMNPCQLHCSTEFTPGPSPISSILSISGQPVRDCYAVPGTGLSRSASAEPLPTSHDTSR